jgi:peptidoglycan pentaglycine glycine transferase (the first glycine)
MPIINQNQWDTFLEEFPDAHLLQTSQWGIFKNTYGWQPQYLANEKCGAQVLFRKLPFHLTVAYIPKGPVGGYWQDLINEVIDLCRRMNAIVLYIEPDCWEEEEEEISAFLNGFSPSSMTIQPRRTITVSLQGVEDQWLERMKQKTRYNIKLAQKKDVLVEPSNDFATFGQLMQTTGNRDEFGIHRAQYYRKVYELFHPIQACEMFMATYSKQPLAAIMVFRRGKRAWYFYGASNEHERNRMPTYLLQWEAMRWAARSGCTEYDLWGVPDEDENTLEAQFSSRSDGLWGVYRFKRGFGGSLRRTAGIYEMVMNAALFGLYQAAVKFRKQGLS